MKLSRTLAFAATLALAATGANAAQAANVVPGAETTGTVVVTDSNKLTVTVNAADAAATAITGAVKNTSDVAFECAGPQGKDSTTGDVAPADLVAKSHAYYQTNLYRILPSVPVLTPSLPLIGQLTLGNLDLGSAQGMLQGSGGLLGQANGARKAIGDGYNEARLKGHTGLIEAFTVEPGATHEFSAGLAAPASGARTDFDAAAFIMCVPKTGERLPHVFVGYEEGTKLPSAGLSSAPVATAPKQ